MDSDQMASMYAQILNGIPKEQSRFVTDEESSDLWDQISAGIERISAENPNAQFSVPNEVPTIDDGATGETSPDTGPDTGAGSTSPQPGSDTPTPAAAPSEETSQGTPPPPDGAPSSDNTQEKP